VPVDKLVFMAAKPLAQAALKVGQGLLLEKGGGFD